MKPEYILQRPIGMFEKNQIAKQLTKGYASVTLTAILDHPSRSSSSSESESTTHFYKKQLYPALNLLIQSHPMLQLCVLNADQPSARFVQLTTLKLDDLVIVSENDRYWETECQKRVITNECQHEFDLFALKPLWRLNVSAHSDRSDQCSITFTVQHVIADGLSTLIVWKDLLRYLNNQHQHQASFNNIDITSAYFDTSKPCNIPLPIEQRNAPKDPNVKPGPPVPEDGWEGDFPAPEKEQLDTIIHLMQIRGDTWSQLIQKSKQHQVSLHAIIYSAYLLSWTSIYPDISVKTVTAINCRPYCDPPVGNDELGIFFGRFEYGWPKETLIPFIEQQDSDETSSSSSSFWKLAKVYHQLVQENKLLTCQRSLLMEDALPTYPESYCNVWYQSRKSFKMGRSGGLNISDLGKFVQEDEKNNEGRNKWVLNNLWFCQSAHIYATVIAVNVVTSNGNMNTTITWQRGSIIEEKALKFVEKFKQTLENEALK
ncbi:unnamed protein product [Cunninghamella echinulata]